MTKTNISWEMGLVVNVFLIVVINNSWSIYNLLMLSFFSNISFFILKKTVYTYVQISDYRGYMMKHFL